MSQKTVATLLLLVASALGGPVAVEHAMDVQVEIQSSVAITGPTECVVGELIELKITGTRPSWLPPTSDVKVLNDTLVLSFRENGEYEVIGSAVAGRTTQTVKHMIVVGEPVVVVPDNPTPPPAPTPLPEDSQLTESVYDWCVEAGTDKAIAKQLADNFIYAATNSTSIDTLLKTVAERNRKVDQRTAAKVLAKVQQHLYDELASKGFAEHQCAFDEIGQGFLRYSGDNTGSIGIPGYWN